MYNTASYHSLLALVYLTTTVIDEPVQNHRSGDSACNYRCWSFFMRKCRIDFRPLQDTKCGVLELGGGLSLYYALRPFGLVLLKLNALQYVLIVFLFYLKVVQRVAAHPSVSGGLTS